MSSPKPRAHFLYQVCQGLLLNARSATLVLFTLMLCLLPVVISPALLAAGEPQVILNGHRLDLSPVVISDEDLLLPLEKLVIACGGVVTDQQKGRVEVRLGKEVAVFSPGSREVTQGEGKKITGDSEAVVMDGVLLVPSSLVAQVFGLQRNWDSNRRILTLQMPLAVLEGIVFREEGGRPIISLVTDRVVTYTLRTLTQPDRLVVDLAETRLGEGTLPPPVNNPMIKNIRASQFTPRVTRVVVEMARSVGVKAATSPSRPQQLDLSFPIPITGVEFSREDGQGRLLVKGSGALTYEVLTLSSPPRLVVDLPGTALAMADEEVDPHDAAVKLIRLSQYTPDQVRVVLDLTAPLGYQTVLTPEAERVVLHLLDEVVGISVSREASGGRRVSILTTGGRPPQAMMEADPTRLVVEFPQAILGTGNVSLPVNDGVIKQIQAVQPTSDTVRLVVELAYQVGYQLKELSPTEVALDLKPSSVYGRRIVLDPGHGGQDPGAISRSGLREKDVVLDIALRMEKILLERGAEVFLTRRDDTFIPLYDRSALANAQDPEAFISIHVNSFRNTTAAGTEAYYYPDRSEARRLAEVLAEEMRNSLGLDNRWIRGNREFVVTRETEGPAVLFEVAFLSNPEEEKLLADPNFRQQVAEAMVKGLERFFLGAEPVGGPVVAVTGGEGLVD